MSRTRVLSRSVVQELITMDDVLVTVEDTFRAHGQNEVVMPAKITLDLKSMGIDSWTNAMPAYVKPYGAAGIKWAGGYIGNPQLGLPYIVATIILQDPFTGQQLAIMDGSHITNLRTGAAAAITAKYLAATGSSRVAMIGAGMQGRTSLHALTRVLEVTEVTAYDISSSASLRYAEEMSRAFGIPVRACNDPRTAVLGADIVITATPADEPIVKFEWLKKGSLAISLGSYQEFDDDTPRSVDKVFVDSWAQCEHRGELARLVSQGRFSRDRVSAEIGDVIAGRSVGRVTDSETILAVPIGLGSLDIAIAKVVYDRALELGRGTDIDLA